VLLAESGVMRIEGADAQSFLQGQLSNDLQLLTPQASLIAAYSTPQGRVIAIPRLILRDADLLAILPRDLVDRVIERLRKYVLRSKVRLTNATVEFLVVGLLDEGLPGSVGLALPSEPGMHTFDGTVSAVRLPGATPRQLLLGPTLPMRSLLERLPQSLPDDEEWRLASIAAGEPQIYAATSELFVAQMLNLDLIGALSFSKGCYTGQEIITRTQHLGRIKRRMLRFQLPAGVHPQRGDTITLAPGRTGRVVERAHNAAGHLESLAVIALAEGQAASAPADIDSAISLPLPYDIPGADRTTADP
jgi:tRNA-modifying protein YgfZ